MRVATANAKPTTAPERFDRPNNFMMLPQAKKRIYFVLLFDNSAD
jgi:hypothetical protein